MELLLSVASTFFLHENPTSPSNRHKISVGPEKPPLPVIFKNSKFFFSRFFPHTGTSPPPPPPEKSPYLLFLKIQNSLFGDFFPTLEPPLPSTSWCCSLNRIRASTQLFIKNFFFYDHPIYLQYQRTLLLPPSSKTNPGDTH